MASIHNQDKAVVYDINVPYGHSGDTHHTTKYPDYLPTWEKDPALRVTDASLPNLLASATAKLSPMQPHIGTVVSGVQLQTLSPAAKDELAYLISYRKVVAFPDQSLIDAGPQAQEEFMRHFGKLNYQPVSGSVSGHPAFHIIHRDGNREEIARFLAHKASTTLWHQDVSYEAQPPGYVLLGLLQGPEVGGDTVFADTDAAYQRLSPALRSLLDPLTAIHSSASMIAHVRSTGGLVRKDAVTTRHPLVRVHPITGARCLFVNNEFIARVEGLKEGEQKAVMEFLLGHIVAGHDFQVRVKWAPGTVVMFDNRSTLHSAIVDYVDDEYGAQARHIFRLCAMAEKPIQVANQASGHAT